MNVARAVSQTTLERLLSPFLDDEESGYPALTTTAEMRQHLFPVTRTNTYLNHAANGPPSHLVVRALRTYLDDVSSYGCMHSERWELVMEQARARLACMMNARPNQIAFTASTSDSLMTIAGGLHWKQGDVVLVAEDEFPSNVYPWLQLAEQGVTVEFVPARNARILAEDVIERITQRTRLVSLSLVEFCTGYRNDIATIARYCHERGILCGTNAMQALGAIDIDVQELDVDFLAAGAHKWLMSLKACGILYVSDALLPQMQVPRCSWYSVEQPFDFFNYHQSLRAGAERFEYSLPNYTPIVGLNAALSLFEHIAGGMPAIEKRILELAAYAIGGLQRLGYPVISPQSEGERSGIVCITVKPEQEQTVRQMAATLEARQISVTAYGNILRIAPHFYNTFEEIDTLLTVLEESED